MKNAGKACNNRLYRHIRTFEKIVKNYFVILATYPYKSGGKKELEKIFSSSFFRLCMSQQKLPYTPQQDKDMSQLHTLPC